MRKVTVAQGFPGTVHEAETAWYDTSGWSRWIDGLDRVIEVSGDWPHAGSSVSWVSGPAGRGRVIERVTSHEPLGGQTVEVRDDSIEGRQTVEFVPVDGSVEVVLSLEYEITERNLFTSLIDVLFIRRAMANSLRTTLLAFGTQLAALRARGERLA